MNEVTKFIILCLCLCFVSGFLLKWMIEKSEKEAIDFVIEKAVKEAIYFENKKNTMRELAAENESNEGIGKIDDKNNIISLEEMIKMYDEEFSKTSYISRQNTIYLKELKCRRYEVEYFRSQTIKFAEIYICRINEIFKLNQKQYNSAIYLLRETLKDVGIMDADSLFPNANTLFTKLKDEKKEGAAE